MLEKLSNPNKVIGIKQSGRAILEENVKIVFIANDADNKIVKDIYDTCINKGITLCSDFTMEQLGQACSIDVCASIVTILK